MPRSGRSAIFDFRNIFGGHSVMVAVLWMRLMEKRDRFIRIHYHRKSEALLLFPYVCYMAGMGAGFGDAAILTCDSDVGTTIIKMLKYCSKAKVEPLAKRRTEALQRKWRGEDVAINELHPGFVANTNWADVTKKFPSLTKGPATYHRTFAVATIVERDDLKSRKLTQVIRSSNANCETDGESIRIPLSSSTRNLGIQIVNQMQKW
jgi:hypothetical protein